MNMNGNGKVGDDETGICDVISETEEEIPHHTQYNGMIDDHNAVFDDAEAHSKMKRTEKDFKDEFIKGNINCRQRITCSSKYCKNSWR